MNNGLFDDIPISNSARDKAWAAFSKRKDAKQTFRYLEQDEFRWPLKSIYWNLWCIAWQQAWDDGFMEGLNAQKKSDA